MFLLCVFRQDNQPCDIMEQSQTVTISCVSSNKISHPINFMLQYLPTCSTFLHYFHPWFVSLISLSLCSSRTRVHATVIRTPTPAGTTGTVCRHASQTLATTPTSSSFLTTNGKVGVHLSRLLQHAFRKH